MGNTDSNTKSSLLKNFQYLTDTKNGTTKLLYFDYLNFLHYELQHEAWKWEIYKNHVKGRGGGGNTDDAAVLFCAWKQIQNHIFDTLNNQLKDKNKYDWEKDVLPLIDIKEKDVLGSQNCNGVTVDFDKISELNNSSSSSNKVTSGATCSLNTASNLHIPLRRRALLVDSMYDYLKDINEQITDKNSLKKALERKIQAKTEKGEVAVGLKKEMIDGISDAISNLIHEKHKNDHKAFCNEWYRTMEDYHTLLLGNDIVDENETKEIQCVIKKIEQKVEGKENFQKEWSQHFKDNVKRLQTKEFTNKITQTPCNISHETKSQCVRFFEEWAEEFCALKRNLGNMVVSECGGKSGTTQSGNCQGLCGIYKKFMKESKPYFNTYMDTCADTQYGNTGQTQGELQKSFSDAAMNSMTDCCTDSGHCSPDQLFDLKENKSNIRYKCLCKEGLYHKEKDKKSECEPYVTKNTVTHGTTVPAPPQRTAGHSVAPTTQTPNCDDENGQCELKKYIEKSVYNELSNKSNCCGLKSDVNGKGIKWRNSKDDKYEYLAKRDVPSEVYLPPRKQNLCFKDLDNTKFTTTDDLKSQLFKVGATEGYNLGEYYKAKQSGGDKYNYDVSACSALKYSFLDLRDIILGYDMVEPIGHGTEDNLQRIFNNNGGKSSGSSGEPGKPGSDKRKQWWESNKDCVWNAMLCGYKRGRDGNSGNTKSDDDLKSCNINDTTYPIGIDRDSGTKFQFLRWAAEWSEDFCQKRKTLANAVVTKCGECKKASEKYHGDNTIGNKSSGSSKNSGGEYTGKDGKDCGNNSTESECTECKTKCDACKTACGEYKNFVEGKSGGKNNWRHQWNNMNTRYQELMENAKKKLEKYHEDQQQKKTPNTSGSSIPPYMTKCENSVNSGKNELCVKPDINSFFQNLYDKGISTLSSYINMVSQNTDCGDDNAKWGRHTVVQNTSGTSTSGSSTTGGDTTTSVFPQPLGDRPTGYKYACQCKIPSREELCGDNDMYNTRWKCENSVNTKPTRTKRSAPKTSDYVLCKDKSSPQNTEAPNAKLGDTKLSEDDFDFFISFDQWYKDIQNMLDQNIKRITDECDQTKIMTPQNGGTTPSVTTDPSGNVVSPECSSCRNSCECYKLWVSGITEQWDKQKDNYNKFENKQKKQTSGAQPSGSSHTDVVDMNKFLFASCWGDYIEKQSHRGKIIDISQLVATDDKDGQMLDVLMDRCGDKPSGATKKFNERIDKAQKQTTQCHKKQQRCQKQGQAPNCNGISDVGKCGKKEYDDTGARKKKDWKCTQSDEKTWVDGVCVPPRTQSLCVANMYGNKGGTNKLLINDDNKDTWKSAIQNAMKKETMNLYDYYTSTESNKGAIISKKSSGDQKSSGKTDPNGMPQNFCLAAERTYNDFKHMVLGDSISKHPAIGEIGRKIEEVLQQNGGKGGTTPKDWWEKNSDKFWDAIKCGIKNSVKTTSATGNECGRYPPDNDLDSQFVWWFKEWAQQFCVERNTYMKDINATCSGGMSHNRCDGNGKDQKLKKDCQKACDDYKEFIGKKKNDWNKQKKKYEIENEGKKAEELFSQYPECLDANFETIFGPSDNTKSGKQSGGSSEYGDASDICSCEQQQQHTYRCNKVGNTSTCQEKTDYSTWSNIKVKKGKDNRKLEGVYAPPRRQKLCLANLFPINFGKDEKTDNKKNTLENRVKIIAEREAYFLWKYYHKNGSSSTTTATGDTNEDKKACCAIRRSFFDIGDIVKGTDLWHDAYTRYIDGIISGIFKEELEKQKTQTNNAIDPEKIKQARKKWWDHTYSVDMGSNDGKRTTRDSVWHAMQCGVTNAMNDKKNNGQTYEHINCMKDNDNKQPKIDFIPTPQFARWLIEWTHQFCDEYTTQINDVKTKCGNGSGGKNTGNHECNTGDNGECKKACADYTKWINIKKTEWNGMSQYYEKVQGKSSNESPDGVDYSTVMISTAIGYLNQKCKETIDGTNKCCYCDKVGTDTTTSGGNEKPLEHIDLVVALKDQRYKKYRGQCTNCQLKHIKEQIQKIGEKVQARQRVKNSGGGSSGTVPQAKSQDANGGNRGSEPVATKPEVPRPQAAKPVDSPPASRSHTTTVTPTPTPPPPPAAVSPQAEPAQKSTKNCKAPDQVDGGTCQGGHTINTGIDGRANVDVGVSVQVATEPNPVTATTVTSTKDSVGPSSSSSSSSGGGGPSGNNSGHVDKTGAGATQPDKLDDFLKTIAGGAALSALGAEVLGYAGTLATIAAAKAGLEVAKKVGPPLAQAGLDAATQAGSYVLEKIKDLDKSIPSKTTGQSTATASSVVDSAQAQAQAKDQAQALSTGQTSSTGSANSGSSGTGSTGNQGTSGHSASGPSGPGSQPQQQASPVLPASSPGSATPSSPSGSQSSPSGKIPIETVVSSSVPVGISIALGSIALLYYLKKKTTAKSPDLFRVLEIPQNDGGIPTYRSANKYVPYTKYRGKTYIYVEENDDDTYIGDISSSDVTTSSDSEVDEIDIYKPLGGGKHKTLIDIILKPSGNHSTSDIPRTSGTDIVEPTSTRGNIYSDTIHSGSDILDTTIPGDHSTSDTTYSGDIYGANFIIQIQDRQLGGNNTYIYDVGGDTNSGTQIYRGIDLSSGVYTGSYSGSDMSPHTTNTHIYDTTQNGGTTTPSDNMDIVGTTTSSGGIYSETHVSPSGKYSGINLINDSLYRDRHIDIYEELLQRKEKEQHMW